MGKPCMPVLVAGGASSRKVIHLHDGAASVRPGGTF